VDIACYSCAKDGGTNQDAHIVQSHPRDETCQLFAIADGQGGRAGAADASQTACETAIRLAAAYAPRRLLREQPWHRIARKADKAVKRATGAGFTTLITGCVTPTTVCGVACGDSAVVLACGPYTDHLTTEAMKNPPVGSGAAPFTFFCAGIVSPWTLLIMTDGVWKSTGWSPVLHSAASHADGQQLIETLRRNAFRAGGLRLCDDFTMIVIQG
jgi:PPM family protein phosphatase